jgi:hypothetical protein
MKRIVYTISRMAAVVADLTGRVFHRKGETNTFLKDGFNYVHPYDPFYQYQGKKKKKRAAEVKLDEFEISAFHDGN